MEIKEVEMVILKRAIPSLEELLKEAYTRKGYDKYFEFEFRNNQGEKDKKQLVYLKEGREIFSIDYLEIEVRYKVIDLTNEDDINNRENKITDVEIISDPWSEGEIEREVIFADETPDTAKYKKFIKPCSYIKGNNVKENEIYELDIYKEKYDPEEENFRVHFFILINKINIKDRKIFLEDNNLIGCFNVNFSFMAQAAIINEKAEVFKDEEIKQKLIKDYKFDMKIRDKEDVYYRRCDYIFD